MGSRKYACTAGLRHSHATHLLGLGVHPKIAQKRLGHSSIGITLDLYSHVMPGMQDDPVAKVDAALQAALNKSKTKQSGFASNRLANGRRGAQKCPFYGAFCGMTAIFITGTGTEVGKTFVAAALIRHLRQMGRTVEAIKPVVSGFDPDRVAGSDPAILLEALGFPATLPNIERISPWRLRAAMSPDAAARQEDCRIDVDELVAFCQSAIAQRQEILLIEGVGGIMVPLDQQRTILDVMMALQLPLVLVTGSYLGTISHTLTALDALFRRDLSVLAIVVSETPTSTIPLKETVAAIGRFAEPVIGLPRLQPEAGDTPASGTLAAFYRIFGSS